MSWYEAIIWLATLIGAVSAIVVAVRKAIKPWAFEKSIQNKFGGNIS